MYKSDVPKPSTQSLDIIAEVRTCDNGKLLFQIAVENGEASLLIKRKGDKSVYHIPVRDLNALIQPRLP